MVGCIAKATTHNVFSQNDTYEIYVLKFGERTNKVPVADLAVGASGNDSLNVCFMFWLLKGDNGKTVLVDAGFTDDQEINPKYIFWTRPDKMLDKINIKASDVTDIILTHPHWDHIGGIDLFPPLGDFERAIKAKDNPACHPDGFRIGRQVRL